MRRNERLNLAAIHNGFTYQLQAVEAVKGMEYAALFHEQGLGKTKIGIDLALENLGMTTLTIRNTGGTDHLAFDAIGLPGGRSLAKTSRVNVMEPIK